MTAKLEQFVWKIPEGKMWTPARGIQKYLEIREEEREDKKAFEERSTRRKAQMKLLEGFFFSVMEERKEKQIKTEDGTAYQSPQMRVTMANRDEVIAFTLDLVEKNDPDAFCLWTNHISADGVKLFADQRKLLIPGVNIDRFTAVNVLKA